ncbi:hypothetical protein [Vulgatibacter sp.]|uniref:hypothetical protein n=1 Tax=Vulgatibacter sp. TaxID=1971226 RepID=UPI003562BFCC
MRKVLLTALPLVALAACATSQPKPVEAQSEHQALEAPATESEAIPTVPEIPLETEATPAPEAAAEETAPVDATAANE